MLKKPFSKVDHTAIIIEIAKGMAKAGFNDAYLELGIAKGATFNAIAPMFGYSTAVDISNKSYLFIQHNKHTQFFNCTTDQFFAQDNGNKEFNLAFIDACHEKYQVIRDFNNTLDVLADNGLVILHDTYPPSEEFMVEDYCYDSADAISVIRENVEENNYEMVTLPFYYGITIVRKCSKHLHWR